MTPNNPYPPMAFLNISGFSFLLTDITEPSASMIRKPSTLSTIVGNRVSRP